MAIFGSSFTYNGKSSDDFGVILCVADQQPDSIAMGLTREALKGEITSRRPVANWYNTKYSDVLSFEVTITKPENRAFSRDEVRDINAWLTGPRTPTLLFFEDEAFDPINYYGVFTDVTNTYGSGILMLTYTFTCDAPYGWSNEREFKYTSGGVLEVVNDTDEINDFVYPLLEISASPGQEIEIENLSEISSNLLTHKIKFTIPSEINGTAYKNPLYMNSKFHKIYYKLNSITTLPVNLSNLGFSTDDLINLDNGSLGLYWPRLVPGTNKFNITGDCSIRMIFRSPRKVGAY